MADPVSLAINAALIAANMALTASQQFEGPRLSDTRVSAADYGTALNYIHGKRRIDGTSCIWAEPLTEVKRRRKTKGGKFNEYTYYGTWAQAVCDCETDAILRIWFDRNLVYDATGSGPLSPFDLGGASITDYMTFYLGTATQEVDPRMAATIDAEHGDGSTPAYRGVTYIVFKDLPLEKLGNRLPQVSVEATTSSASAYPMAEREAAEAASTVVSLSPDGTRSYWVSLVSGAPGPVVLEIWDNAAAALMNSVELHSDDIQPARLVAVDAAGLIYAVGNSSEFIVLNADGIGTVSTISTPVQPERPIYTIDAAGVERIIFTRWSSGSDGVAYEVGGVSADLIDTSALTGYDWQVKFAFVDTYGDVWLLGGAGDLAGDQLAIYRYVNASGRAGPDFAALTMPVSNGGAITQACGYHRADDTHDMIVVRFGLGTGCIAQIAIDDLTLIDSEVALADLDETMCAALVPGAETVWVEGTEWDFSTFTEVRTVHASSWDATFASNQTMLYDRISHALIRTSGAVDFQWLYLDRASGSGVTLQSIVEDVCDRAGLVNAVDFDASDLTQTVPGYSWSQGTGKAILGPILEAYDSEARPHDWLIEFLRRGDAVGASIPVTDMGAGGTLRYTITTIPDSDLPLKVNLTFADIDRDQQPNTAIGQRAGEAADTRRELSLDASTLALDADVARPMAEGYLRREWIKAQTVETSLTRAYTALEPGDAHSLVCDDVTVSAKLTRLEFGANGVLTTEWERYAASVHVASSLGGAPADGMDPDEVAVFGYTKGLALDIPLVVDSDEATQPFVYLAAAPYGDTTWPGATFYRSDDGSTFDEELGSVAASQVAVMGYALTVLPDALTTCWDNASTVSVKLFDGELTSSTKALVGNGANLALLGDELIGFTTATLTDTDTYELSGLIRGRRGSEWATGTHAEGDAFVLLDSLPTATMSSSDVDTDVYVRPTTSGGPDGFVQHFNNYTGAALKPYAPAHLTIEESAGDYVVTWTRRTRIGGTWRDYQDVPLGEGSEAYIGRILDANGGIIRTFSGLTSETFTYTAAQQAADGSPAGVSVAVAQVSATIGNGYFAEAAL